MFSETLATFILLFGLSVAFPSDIEKCPIGDVECLKNTINVLLHTKAETGIKELAVPPFHPLKLDDLRIKKGSDDSPLNIDIQIKSPDFYGWKDSVITKIKGFGEDLKGPHEIVFKSKPWTMIGDYDGAGKILILPLQGKGRSNLTSIGNEAVVKFTGVPVIKDGKEYLKLDKFKHYFTIKRLYVNFENLFNGNKLLGDTTNQFLNDNWELLYNELKDNFYRIYGNMIKKTLTEMFDNIPYRDLFA